MTTAPIVSVVIPAYGHADYILDALQSVFRQTFKNFEVVVINDGSPDETAEVLTPLSESGQIRYVERENGGQASARNLGIKLARGRFVALLDDDDVWPPDHLAWQTALLETLPAHVGVAGAMVLVGGDVMEESLPSGRDYGPSDFIQSCLLRSPGQALFRKEALDRVGGFDERIWGADDWDLYLRITEYGPIRFEPRTALQYRVHEGNASKNYWRLFRNARRVYRTHRRNDAHYNPLKWIWIGTSTAHYFSEQAALAAGRSSPGPALVHKCRSKWLAVYPTLRNAAVTMKSRAQGIRRSSQQRGS